MLKDEIEKVLEDLFDEVRKWERINPPKPYGKFKNRIVIQALTHILELVEKERDK